MLFHYNGQQKEVTSPSKYLYEETIYFNILFDSVKFYGTNTFSAAK